MATLDWIVIALFLAGIMGISLALSKRASGDMTNFFLSGRNLPWWLAGTSILATSFASDTPLHVTKVIREEGLGGAWFYWTGILAHLTVAFFFARLWRRTQALTDAELIEMRYSGKPAAALRGLLGGVRGLIFEGLTLAWVILGMSKVIGVVLDVPPEIAGVDSGVFVVLVLLILVLVYSVTAGLWGVVVTDFIEFVVAMGGAFLLAGIAYAKVGGPSGLREGLVREGYDLEVLAFFPDLSAVDMSGLALAVYIGVQWWANDSIDGSGKRAQRFLACKSERDALASGVWNVAVQWILRSWPWYLTALASMVLYPSMVDSENAYPTMMAELLPVGLKGLMIAAFLAAFMSTVDTHLNLCSAYLTNDIYRRFVKRDESELHYLRASKMILVAVAVIMAYAALNLRSVLDAFKLKLELMSGIGLALVARWLWWRINAWTELAALVSSVACALIMRQVFPDPDDFPIRMLSVVSISTVIWLVVTLVTRPEPEEKLVSFYRRVHPPAAFWGPIKRVAPEVKSDIGAVTFAQAALCGLFAFSGMFGVGKLLLGDFALGAGLVVVSAISATMLLRWIFPKDARAPASESPHA